VAQLFSLGSIARMNIKLVNKLEQEVPTKRPSRMDDLWLGLVAQLWRGFYSAKRNVVRRFASDTTRAERILRVAKRRGILRLCVERGLLPAHAEALHVDEGAAFCGHYPTLEDESGNRPRLVSGGAFETHPRRH